MTKKSEEIALLEAIIQSINLIGVDGTLVNIKGGINRLSDTQLDDINFLIGKVCIYFKISQKKLILGTSKGDRIDARDSLAFLIRKNINLSLKEISELFYKKFAESHISTAIKRISNLDNNNKQEFNILSKINLIQSEYEQFKKEKKDE